VSEALRAQELDPASVQSLLNVAIAHREAGQNEQAISEFRRALQNRPELARAHFQLGISYVVKGDLNSGITELQKAVTLSQRNPRFLAHLGYAEAVGGHTADATEILAELEEQSRRQFVSPVDIAEIHVSLAHKEQAFSLLEKACEARDPELTRLMIDSGMDAIRSDSRFDAVVRRVGLIP